LKVRPEISNTSVAPGPPLTRVSLKGRASPAPAPVTVALPFSTALRVWISADVIVPVTYMMFLSKLPLPALPAGALGVSAKHSKWPRPLLQDTANFVKIGANEGAPVPP
jgi:hypothetical protein